jgi:regulator of protease activity HflC (stomatin/prohibitin superfamily)
MMELVLAAAAFLGLITVLSSVRILREYERGVVFRLGRARQKLLGPGLGFLIPFGVDKARVVDTRIKAINIQPQEVITRDNISIVVDAVVYAMISSPAHAILEVEQYLPATELLAATTLRAVLGKMDLDDILAKRDEINTAVRSILDERTEQWGVEITAVELKDIILPHEMKRAMARQAEAERERRAKVIAAEGEVQSATMLSQAAQTLSATPAALQLRLYQTLVEVSGESNNTIVFPLPIELLGSGDRGIAAQAMMQSSVALAANKQPEQLKSGSGSGGAGIVSSPASEYLRKKREDE